MNELDHRKSLDPLDPGSHDPGFWLRFHGRVMSRAQDELARRRMMGELSVVDILFQWRKPLVPMALLTAAMAGIFVLGNEEPVPAFSPVALEDVLIEDVSGDPIPSVLAREAELQELAFLSSAGGF